MVRLFILILVTSLVVQPAKAEHFNTVEKALAYANSSKTMQLTGCYWDEFTFRMRHLEITPRMNALISDYVVDKDDNYLTLKGSLLPFLIGTSWKKGAINGGNMQYSTFTIQCLPPKQNQSVRTVLFGFPNGESAWFAFDISSGELQYIGFADPSTGGKPSTDDRQFNMLMMLPMFDLTK